jgi:hypothetical protein
LQIIDKEYLIDDKALKKKEAIIVNQGKILWI